MRYYSEHGFELKQPRNGDAGYDIICPFDATIPNDEIRKINTGLQVEIPEGHVGILFDKSSVAAGNSDKGLKGGIKIMGGVIDSSYRGDIIVALMNLSKQYQTFKKGQKICQMIIMPIATPEPEQVDEPKDLSTTKRGKGGFGSTGQIQEKKNG